MMEDIAIYPIVIETEEIYPYKHVYPTHQSTLKLLMDYFPTDSGIDRVYLFGSIITKHTGQDSDLDIIIVTNDDRIVTELPYEYWGKKSVDLLNVSKKEFDTEKIKINSVYRDAYLKGIEIYNKGGDNV